jgi:two-component sensor histidine kinase
MPLGAEALAVLDAIAEPALIIDRQSFLAAANRRAHTILPIGAVGRPFQEIGMDAAGETERFLDRCRGSSGGLLGALHLRGMGDTTRKHRCRGARIQLPDGAGILLTLDRGEEVRFMALSRKVTELDEEVRERRHAEAVLAESLRERDLLLRELQHRVKNNIHMLVGLLQGAERETGSAEAKVVLRDIALRFRAVGAVQQLIYGAGDLETVESGEMIETITRGASALGPGDLDLVVEAEPIALPIESAVPVALILNELVTNAVKYGRPQTGRQRIDVTWRREAGHIVLEVQDNGPGFIAGDPTRRASGLGLVRGLLRQLGGSLSAHASPLGVSTGAHCAVRFPVPRARRSGGGEA